MAHATQFFFLRLIIYRVIMEAKIKLKLLFYTVASVVSTKQQPIIHKINNKVD